MKLLAVLILVAFTTKIESLGEDCTATEDCGTLQICGSNNKCSCQEHTLQIKDNCYKYTTEFQGECLVDDQCKWMGSNYKCKKNSCSCEDSYTWLQGACKKTSSFGQTCQNNEICYNGYDLFALTCKNNVCSCSDNYYLRHYDCRLKSKEDSSCAIDEDCQDLNNLSCNTGTCSKKTKEVILQKLQMFEEEVQEKETKDKADLGTCTEDSDCTKTKNTQCFEGECVCKPGYFYISNSCHAELGMLDNAEKSCNIIKPSQWSSQGCVCKDYWIQDKKNQNCQKTMSQSNQNCLNNAWCQVLGPYSTCQIQPEESSGTCTCTSDAVLQDLYCNKKDTAPPVECHNDDECPATKMTCSNEKCVCNDLYYLKDNTCFPKIGGSCLVEECSGLQTLCNASYECQCSNQDLINDGTNCYEVRNFLGDSCTISAQCSTIPHSICLDQKCSCEETFADVGTGVCVIIKEELDNCSNLKQCTDYLGESYQCRNSLCQCPVYMKSDQQGKCVSTSGVSWFDYSILIQTILSTSLYLIIFR